ncbi:DUF1493 family protein [Brenneria goodwinii]|uniref:DUF1493 family protein n=1 Tax=Brenneria goodwinii TaxID=1109412 RepID=UPI0036E2A285
MNPVDERINDIDERVLAFFRKHLPDAKVLFSKRIERVNFDTVLQDFDDEEYILEAVNAFHDEFNIDMTVMDWKAYFPWNEIGIWDFLKGKKIVNDKKHLTVRMFAESVKAGRWLYD